MKTIHKISFVSFISCLLIISVKAQQEGTTWRKNVSALAIEDFGGFGAGNLWYWKNQDDSKDYILLTLSKGLSIIDVSDLNNPQERVYINATNNIKNDDLSPNLNAADVRVYESGNNAYAYLARDTWISAGNPIVYIIDIKLAITTYANQTIFISPNNPSHSVVKGTITNRFAPPPPNIQAHTITITDGILYISTLRDIIDIYNLKSKPDDPSIIGHYIVPQSGGTNVSNHLVHEIYAEKITNDRHKLYVSYTFGGLKVITLSGLSTSNVQAVSIQTQMYDFDKANPTVVKQTNPNFDYRHTHSAWPISNGNYILTTDELKIDDDASTLYSSGDPLLGVIG
jgi:hypothetical protein